MIMCTKQTEEILISKRDRAQQYFDVAEVMLICLDRNQNIIQINKKGCKILEYTEEEILGKNWFDNFLPQKNIARVKDLFEKFISGEKGGIEYYEKAILTKSGKEKLLSWHDSIIKDDSGRVISILSSGEDITERKKAQDALLKSEENYRLLAEKYVSIFQTVPVSIVMTDKNGQINDINRYHLDHLGGNKVNKEHYFKHKIWEYPSVKATGSVLVNGYKDVLKGKTIDLKSIYFPVTTEGRERFLNIRGVPLLKDKEVIGGVIINEDVTEHLLAEKTLRNQTQIHQTLMNIAFDCINVPLDKVDHAINSALEKMGTLLLAHRGYVFKYDFKNNIAVNTHEWCARGIEPQIENLQASPLEDAPDWVETHLKEESLIVQDVSTLPFGNIRDILESQQIKSLITIPLFQGSKLKGFLGFDFLKTCHAHSDTKIDMVKFLGEILINLNKRAKEEENLLALNKTLDQKVKKRTQELNILNEHLIHTEEKERSNIASELHDTVAQSLALSVSKIKTMKESDSEDNEKMLSDVQNLIEQSLHEIRQLIYQLCPPVVKDFDIATALGFLVEEMNGKFQADIQYTNNFDNPVEMDEPKRISLYRAANELILNVIKHSGRKKAKIELLKDRDTVLLKVEDKGMGFDMTTINKNHFNGFGLFALSERCKNMGGNFQIKSTPGKGTKIKVSIPLD